MNNEITMSQLVRDFFHSQYYPLLLDSYSSIAITISVNPWNPYSQLLLLLDLHSTPYYYSHYPHNPRLYSCRKSALQVNYHRLSNYIGNFHSLYYIYRYLSLPEKKHSYLYSVVNRTNHLQNHYFYWWYGTSPFLRCKSTNFLWPWLQ